MADFQLVAPYQPAGDQPAGDRAARRRLRRGQEHQTLLGVTGSGKTFTMANVIAQHGPAGAGHVAQQDARRPALRRVQGVLPAQRRPLLRQLLRLLPARGLHPPARHLHREGRRDQRGDRAAPAGLHQRPGQPRRRDRRRQRLVHLRPGLARRLPQDDGPAQAGRRHRPRRDAAEVRRHPVRPQRRRRSSAASSACGATSSSSGRPTRRSATGSSCSATRSRRWPTIDPLTGAVLETHQEMYVYPAKHFVLPEERIKGAVESDQRGAGASGSSSSRSRASSSKPSGWRPGRATTWRCSWRSATARGSRTTRRHLSGRKPGETPNTLLDFFPPDSLLFIDESHVSVPQIRGMFAGDFSRKSTLVEHGFRLPSALDNRPLRFDEWEKKLEPAAVTSRPRRATTRSRCPAARSSSR